MPSFFSYQVIIYIACFVVVWLGAGLVVSSISELAKSWRLPSFIISFFLLGILTSLPEITISTISIFNDDPAIMAGNLLGGVIVMFLGVIPLLGVIGNGVRMPTKFDQKQLILTLIVVVAPAFLTSDQRINKWEAIFLIILYLSLFIFFSFKQSFWERVGSNLANKKRWNVRILVKTVMGVLALILASNQIVNSTIYFANVAGISPFFISLIVVALGTNIPEISIIFRSVISKKKDIALADYLGSASANTLLLGIFTLLYGKTVQLPNHFFQRFSFLALGLVSFYFFARSKNTLSRGESFVLLLLYIGFIGFELVFLANT